MSFGVIIQWILDLLMFFLMYLIVTMSLNLMYGYTGIPHFGISLSVAGGAFVAGALTGRILQLYYNVYPGQDFILHNSEITNEINKHLVNDPVVGIGTFILIIMMSLVLNAGLGYIVSRPAIRMSGSYLIIILVGMADAIQVIGINYTPLVGGTFWVSVPKLFAWAGEYRTHAFFIACLIVASAIFLLIQAMSMSPLARVLRAVRENPVSAECVGKDVVGIRTRVIMLGSALTSVTGVLISIYIHTVMASDLTRATWAFYPWLMFMVGGVGNNMGATVGTFVFITVRRLITYYKHNIEMLVPFQVQWLEMIMTGAFLLLILMFRPQGLFPEKPTRMRGVKYGKLRDELAEKGVKVPEKRAKTKSIIQRLKGH